MITFQCDGCGNVLPRHVGCVDCSDNCPGCRNGHEGEVIGRLDKAHYCADCATAWKAHDEAVREKRVSLIREMETFIRGEETALKASALRRLPE